MLVQPQWSNIQKREVTTYLVSARNTGQLHCTIQQAIDKAEPYSRIIVGTGQYYESVTVSQPVELVGDEAEHPEIAGRGVCLSVLGDVECYFENLHVVTKGSPYSNVTANLNAIRGVQSAVRLISGRPMFFHCELSSVFVGGSCAPTISNCLIHGNLGGPGLVVGEEASGIYEKNMICNHIPHCVVVSSRGSPLFRGNDIHQDAKVVLTANNAMHAPTVGGCVLICREGTEIESTVAPHFVGNRIGEEVVLLNMHPTHLEAMSSADEVYNADPDRRTVAQRVGVQVDAATSPSFEENQIIGGHIGFNLMTGGSGSIVGNTIAHASFCGISLGHLSTPVVRFNTVEKCATGIFVQGTAATVTHNNVKENLGAGMLLLLSPSDNFRMDANSFVANECGIIVRSSRSFIAASAVAATTSGQSADDFSHLGGQLSKLRQFVESERKKLAVEAAQRDEEERARKRAEAERNGQLKAYEWKLERESEELAREALLMREQHEKRGQRGSGGLVLAAATAAAAAAAADANAARDAAAAGLSGAPINPAANASAANGAAATSSSAGALLVRNIVSHNKSCGLAVLGSGFDVTINEMEVGSNGHFGILVAFGATPRIFKSKFEGGAVGLVSENNGVPFVSRCTFTGQTQVAVAVRSKGRGWFRGNSISAFRDTGILIDDGGDPLIDSNQIGHSGGRGVVVSHGGIGVVRGNTFESVAVGISTSFFGDPLVEQNTFRSCSDMGVLSHDEGIGTFIGNEFVACGVGVGAATGGEPTVRDNIIKESVRIGIVAGAGSRMVAEKNRVEVSIGGNVLLEGEDSESTIRSNFIARAVGFGIRSVRHACGLVKGNTVSGNLDGGLSSREHGQTTFDGNTCTNERGSGIVIGRDGRGLFIHNDISGADGFGCELQAGSSAEVVGCTFTRCAKEALHVAAGAGGFVRECTIVENGACGIEFAPGVAEGSAVVESIVIDRNAGEGVRFMQGGSGTLARCIIKNQRLGLFLSAAGKAIVEHCTVSGGEIGAIITHGGHGVLQDCIFEHNTVADVQLVSEGNALIQRCTIGSHSRVGISASTDANGVVEECVVAGSTESGVHVSQGSRTRFTRNRIRENAIGVCCQDGDRSHFLENAISRSASDNVRICQGAGSQLRSNTIEEAARDGVCVNGLGATLTHNTVARNRRHGIYFDLLVQHLNTASSEPQSGMAAAAIRKERLALLAERGTAGGIGGDGSGHPLEATLCAHNTVEENEGAGVFFTNYSVGVLHSNNICKNAAGGVVVSFGATPEVARGNRIHHNRQCGVVLERQSAPLIEHNELTHNTPCNVALREGSIGFLQDNVISAGQLDGIHAAGSGTVVQRNQIVGNADGSGVLVLGPNKHLRIEENVIAENNVGVNCQGNMASGTFVRNEIRNNFICGFRVAGSGAPFVSQNRFEGGSTAVLLRAEAGGTITENTFHNNREGIVIDGDPVSTVCTQNTFSGNAFGVVFRRNDTYELLDNAFHEHSDASVLFEEGSRGSVAQNRFHGGHRGVLATGAASPTIRLNQFEGVNHAVELTARASGDVHSNLFTRCASGVVVTSMDRGVLISANAFSRCSVAGVVVDGSGAAPTSNRNVFSDCDGAAACGLLLRGRSGGVFSENDFHRNRIAVVAAGEAAGEVTSSLIHDNSVGVEFSDKASVSVQGCYFMGNTGGDVVTLREARPMIRWCMFASTRCFASVVARDGGGGLITSNSWKDSNVALLLEGAGGLHFTGNTISGANEGVLMRRAPSMTARVTSNVWSAVEVAFHCVGGGGADVSMNHVDGGAVGVLVERRGCARFTSNFITKCEKYAVAIRGLGSATFVGNTIVACKSVAVHMNVRGGASLAAAWTTPPPLPASPRSVESSDGAAAGTSAGVAEKTGGDSAIPPMIAVTTTAAEEEGGSNPKEHPGAPPPAAAAGAAAAATDSVNAPASPTTPRASSERGSPLGSATAAAVAAKEGDGDTTGAGTPTFLDNVIHRTRVNVHISNGELTMKRNNIAGGDMGVNIAQDASGIFEGNIVHDCMRMGVLLGSKAMHMVGNQFYSMNEEGALEVVPDLGIFLPRDNNVFNNCACKLPIPEFGSVPHRMSDCGDANKTATRDLLASLSHVLRKVHTCELPLAAEIGCPAIAGSGARDEAAHRAKQEAAQARTQAALRKTAASRNAARLLVGGPGGAVSGIESGTDETASEAARSPRSPRVLGAGGSPRIPPHPPMPGAPSRRRVSSSATVSSAGGTAGSAAAAKRVVTQSKAPRRASKTK